MSRPRRSKVQYAQPAPKPSAKQVLKAHINEADTAVSQGANGVVDVPASGVIEISSDPETSDYDYTDEDEPASAAAANPPQTPLKVEPPIPMTNGHLDTDMGSPRPLETESDQEAAAPTFGDLVRANTTIDVPTALSAHQSNALLTPGRNLNPPHPSSLGTVLNQALRTDDTELLESCLRVTDLTTVRNSIQRLDSALAGTLLNKLASRMHRRPGRAGSLMAWMQWILIAHGGALATQMGLMKKLSDLKIVLEERSRGLTTLLTLKGKLDMLEAQMRLRQSMRKQVDTADEEVEDPEVGIIYVEGEETGADQVSGMDMDDGDDLPITNGVDDDSEDEGDVSDDDSDDSLVGVEEAMDEKEVDHDEFESLGEEDESEVEGPPAKKKKTGKQR